MSRRGGDLVSELDAEVASELRDSLECPSIPFLQGGRPDLGRSPCLS